MSELKPCPFCKGPNIIVVERMDKEHPDTVYSMAQCGDCLAEGPLALDYKQAGEEWNTRAESAALTAAQAAIKRRDEVIEDFNPYQKGTGGYLQWQNRIAAKLKDGAKSVHRIVGAPPVSK